MLQLLLGKRAEADAAAEAGVTPLMEAARIGRVDTVRLLARAGADVNVREPQRGGRPR